MQRMSLLELMLPLSILLLSYILYILFLIECEYMEHLLLHTEQLWLNLESTCYVSRLL